jgi:hypothetical protein
VLLEPAGGCCTRKETEGQVQMAADFGQDGIRGQHTAIVRHGEAVGDPMGFPAVARPCHGWFPVTHED